MDTAQHLKCRGICTVKLANTRCLEAQRGSMCEPRLPKRDRLELRWRVLVSIGSNKLALTSLALVQTHCHSLLEMMWLQGSSLTVSTLSCFPASGYAFPSVWIVPALWVLQDCTLIIPVFLEFGYSKCSINICILIKGIYFVNEQLNCFHKISTKVSLITNHCPHPLNTSDSEAPGSTTPALIPREKLSFKI